MISGLLIVEGQVLHAGDFHHAEAESDHEYEQESRVEERHALG